MITVIGLGFVGLTTGLGFSNKGYKVFGFDIDKKKINCIKNNRIPFFEPYLEEELKKNINKNFIIIDDLKQGVSNSKVIFYCVGTPCNNDGSTDLSYIFSALKSTLKIIQNEKDYKVLVIKSTIPPSTTKEKIKVFIENSGFKVGEDIGLTNNPEFLREGYAWYDFINPDRIVIGTEDKKSGDILEDIYKPFNAPIFKVSFNTAEFIKYLSNTLLSTLISFSNEMSIIAYTIGDINVQESFKILHLDKRWNGNPAHMTSYVYPGCGFGGYCLPKDTKALLVQSSDKGYSPYILKSVLETNKKIKKYLIDKVIRIINKDEYIGILGLSFKPNSDDVRETPAKDIIKMLLDKGYNNIIAYDPIAVENFRKEYNFPIEYSNTLIDVVKKSAYLIILTAWKEFKNNKDLIYKKNVWDFRYFMEQC